MTELEVYTPGEHTSLPAKVQYAKELANSGLLPSAYRQRPANILYAIEYGDMLGLSPMAAITGIHVIEGKPTASAGLISALVRRAGHRLRLSGDAAQATCWITRGDDPDYTFKVTFTMADAAKAGLTGKDVWKKYGPSMLKARAITQCARDACEEALFGLHYTPEELGAEVDGDGDVVTAEVVPDGEPAEPPPPDDPEPVETGPTPGEIRDEACDPATDVPRLRDLYRIARHDYLDVVVENECGDAENLVAMLIRLAHERKAEAA